jgi:DNA-binding CsgD family transcriptional regulator
VECLKLESHHSGLKELFGRICVRSMDDIRPAAEALRDAVWSMARVRVAPCANIASKDPMVDGRGNILASEVFGWRDPSERWWERPRLALVSPIVLACRYESEPFWCNAQGIHTPVYNLHLADLDMTNFFGRAMTEAAIVVPIHLPYGQIGAVSFQPAFGAPNGDLGDIFTEFGDLLGALARKFVSSYVKVMSRHKGIPSGVKLSKREIECLRWAAVGKTDGEIALILERSCATIRFHIHNAAIKLNAVSRSQAVFKAGQLGYVTVG